MDPLEKMEVVRTNNQTVMVTSIIVGLLLLIIGLIWAYARSKSKGKIVSSKKIKKNTYDFEDEIIDDIDYISSKKEDIEKE